MADLVNLRRFRKARLRAESEKAAEINRAAFGRSKGERQASATDAERAAERLDGHRLTGIARDDGLDPPPGDD